MINNVPRVNELNQMIDEQGNVILNGFGQPVYFYPQTGQVYYDRPEPGTPEADPYVYRKKHGVYPNGSMGMPGNPYETPAASAQRPSGMAVTAMVLGIIAVVFSLVAWFLPVSSVTGILAIVFGARSRLENKKGLAGMILGIIGFAMNFFVPFFVGFFGHLL